MVVPTLVLQIGCYFGLLTCTTPPGEWSDETPTVISYGPPPTQTQTTTLTSSTAGSTTITTTPVITTTTTTTVTTPTSSTLSTTSTLQSSTESSTFVTSTSVSTTSLSSTSSTSSTSGVTSPSSSVTSSTSTTSTTMSVTSTSIVPSATGSLAANILIIARDSTQASVASSGLNAYGIPFTTLLVPQAGAQLPALNSSAGGNFGGIVVSGEVSYDMGGGNWASALTDDQWNQLYAYQLEYGVRMVQYDVYPGDKYGTTALGDGCCADGVEQLISFSDVSDFPTAGLRTNAGVSTEGLWHYPASISDSSTTKAIATFAANSVTSDETTAAVINNFNGRQQMAFFISFDTTWSATSSYLQHAWITWITRGLHAGYRRVNLNTQIDDMMLQTNIYQPSGDIFRITTADMDGITSWLPTIRGKMNSGSTYFVEIGYNGNGNIEAGTRAVGYDTCSGGGIEYNIPASTPAEFKKTLGTGTSVWPLTPTSFNWTSACISSDDLLVWFQNNLNDYGHLSHTFTHLAENNATYSDITKEISFNQAWLQQVGISSATHFTSNGIIPPAITGIHNGDALRAWYDNGITNCVGDNTRSALLNQQNAMWPYFTSVALDGFDGIQVNPRWSTRIFYNCYSPACTVQEWIDTSSGSGSFDDLLSVERQETMRHLFGLSHDPYMFHQANLRNSDVDPITVNGETAQYSIFQAWVETQVQEFVRLVNWPLVTITHQQMSDNFLQRYRRDQCNYSLSYVLSDGHITGVTLSANGNTCSATIPITFPGTPADTHGFASEQLGNDPLTVWAQLSGSPVTFSLATPIAL